MSETILNWLNTQLEFPDKINNIEDLFSNGYYFGKILLQIIYLRTWNN